LQQAIVADNPPQFVEERAIHGFGAIIVRPSATNGIGSST
jgi:hypothetical protein